METQNNLRGEIQFIFGEDEYQGKVTLDIIKRIELKFQKGIVEIATDLSTGKLKIGELAMIIGPAIRKGGKDLSQSQIEEIIFANGITSGIQACSQVIAEALQTGETTEGKAQMR